MTFTKTKEDNIKTAYTFYIEVFETLKVLSEKHNMFILDFMRDIVLDKQIQMIANFMNVEQEKFEPYIVEALVTLALRYGVKQIGGVNI